MSKPKTPTCKDCLNYATCPERSRLYPCREFKGVRNSMKYELWDVYETLASEESGELLYASDSMAEIRSAAKERIEDTDGECKLLVKEWLDPEKRDV